MTPEQERLDRVARLAVIRDGWYGNARPVSPHGRRIYQAGSVQQLCEQSEARLPSHEAGRTYLRGVLRDWRTEHVVPADFDASRSGAMRRALVATGLALAEETDDGRERADCLVLEATLSVRARKLEVLDADLACRPRSRPARAGPAASRHASHGESSKGASTSGAIPGSSSELWHGRLASAASPSATNDAPIFTSPSPRSPAPSSAELRPDGYAPDFQSRVRARRVEPT